MNQYQSLLKEQDEKYDRLYEWESYRVLKVTDEGETYLKVFGAKSGGYSYPDQWRVNAGITKVVYNDTHIAFFGYTGSVYVSTIGEGRLSLYNQQKLNSFAGLSGVDLVEYDKLFDVLKEHGIEIEYVGEVV